MTFSNRDEVLKFCKQYDEEGLGSLQPYFGTSMYDTKMSIDT